ncbi:MAG: hypothetical protein KJ559_00110 [Nanoarchaeota archaeon]|nr:hypothetical protein [Nanoarchaeota archaeon]
MNGIMLAWAGQGFQDVLNQLESLGFFSYVLPFLLVFAVIYALLEKTEVVSKSRGPNLIISVAAALLSLQFDVVPVFFQNIFPKFGIGIAIMLIALILAGAFISDFEKDDKKIYQWIFFGLGSIIFVIILVLSFSDYQFAGNWWWQQYGLTTMVIILVIVAMIIVATTGKKSSDKKD